MIKRNFFGKITLRQAVTAALFLVEIIVAGQILILLGTIGIGRMSSGAAVSTTVSSLCLILGVFLFIGVAAIRGNNRSYLATAFLLHVLMACDAAGYYMEGNPEYNATQTFIMNEMVILNAFLAPVCLLMLRQFTGMGATLKELLRSRDEFDRTETVAVVFSIMLLLTLWIRNFSSGILFTVSPEGRFVYGSCYTLYTVICFAAEIFGPVRLIRAKRPFRQTVLFILIFASAAAGCLLDRYGITVDISYALTFLLLFLVFSEFFTELKFANHRYSGVLETYVTGRHWGHTDSEPAAGEDPGAGKEYRATVLLSDLRGFTAQCAHMTTKEMVGVLSHYMTVMMGIVRENGGNVTEFLGDGLLCVFGVLPSAEDHADRALTAAVRMQQAMKKVNVWNEERGYPALRMGIGISTGVFTCGNIGTSRAARPMAVGKPVNEVFTAEQYALGGQIIMTGAGIKALKGVPIIRQEILHVTEENTKLKLYQVSGRKDVPELLLTEKEDPLYELEKPLRIAVRRVDGKHVDDVPGEGLLYSISRQKAVIRLPWKPEPLHYICFMPENPPESLSGDGRTAGLPEGTYYARIPASVTGNTVTADLTAFPENMRHHSWVDVLRTKSGN